MGNTPSKRNVGGRPRKDGSPAQPRSGDGYIPPVKPTGGKHNVHGTGGKFAPRDSQPPAPAPDVPAGLDPAQADLGPTVQVKVPTRPVFVPPQARRVSRKEAQRNAEQATEVLLTILDGAVGMAVGGGARMTEEEHSAIFDPMARIMARLDPATNAAVEKYTDPVLLIFGLGMWGVRVWTELAEQEPPPSSGKQPPEPEAPPPAPNGREVEEVPAASPPASLIKSEAGSLKVG